ncbi:hypothetical protein K523DRAFT_94406 [Schizophyllum commune Tattone D]|nr:hypothetical protein K523DRAFT_94406 [Schizophyllum commune Tattone D]
MSRMSLSRLIFRDKTRVTYTPQAGLTIPSVVRRRSYRTKAPMERPARRARTPSPLRHRRASGAPQIARHDDGLCELSAAMMANANCPLP